MGGKEKPEVRDTTARGETRKVNKRTRPEKILICNGMVSQCRVIIEREIETPAAFSNVFPEMVLRQLGIFSQKCENSLK